MAYDFGHADPEEPTGLYTDPRAPEEEPPPPRRLLRISGALLVMGVFAGGVWFAYNQGLRHAGGPPDPGDIPLVRADTRPFKVKPDNPGGMQIPDRDMLIYGEQHAQIEHLLPPPEQPMARPTPPPAPPPHPALSRPPPPPIPGPSLQEAKLQPALTAPPGSPPEEAAGPPAAPALANSTLQQPSAHTAAALSPSGLQAPPSSPSGLPAPTPQTPMPVTPEPGVPPHATAEPASAAPATARPQPAPDLIGEKIEQLEAAATAARTRRSETAGASGVRLRLGAMRSESEARGAWERLKRSNTDLLGNLTGVAVRADLGDKGVYYRIETGPIGNAATAARLCGALRERHLACTILR